MPTAVSNSTPPPTEPAVTHPTPPTKPNWRMVIAFVLSVAVIWLIFYIYQMKKIQPQTTPLPQTTQATPTLDLTANWKTFTNQQYKYQASYPSENWSLSSVSESTIITKYTLQTNDYLNPPSEQKITDMQISILIEKNPNNFTPEEWYCYLETRITHIPTGPSLEILPSYKQKTEVIRQLKEDIEQNKCDTNKIKASTFQGYLSIHRTFDDGKEISFAKHSLMFFIRYSIEPRRTSLSEAESFFDQILSTFKFLE